MRTIASLLSRIVLCVVFVLASMHVASAIVTEPPAHAFLNMSSDGIWTSAPVRVDRRSQNFQRLPTPPDPFPMKFHADRTFKTIDSANFQLKGEQYRIIGASLIERTKTCSDAVGRKHACGLKAYKALDNALRGHFVECNSTVSRQGSNWVQCRVNGHDVLAKLQAIQA